MTTSRCVAIQYGFGDDKYLENLRTSTNRYTYQPGTEELDEIIQSQKSHLENSLRQLRQLRDTADRYDLRGNRKLGGSDPRGFNPQINILILKMVWRQHTGLVMGFKDDVILQLTDMGLMCSVHQYLAVDMHVGGGRIKQADWGVGPTPKKQISLTGLQL
ncbi:hypothetical protein N7478_004235 [Penicillium angulare]|uniref:uncharacterized protein n=1 Tax=Penicillium angulare TaxID=116970 RepID=UPI0025423AFF|nr:uncharacterized protein N7478_004235 [Penicillium angulare]KAJ5278863.1 hypothetical protein N7478_004235 [Penicillium angulare]